MLFKSLDWLIRINREFKTLSWCRSFAAVGVEPGVMGIGPAVAIPIAAKRAGLDVADIDLFEINEVLIG